MFEPDLESEIVYYAMGAGLGHLTRAANVIASLGIIQPVTIVTNSRFLSNTSLTTHNYQNIRSSLQPHNLLHVPSWYNDDPSGFLAWLQTVFEKKQLSDFIIDSFPVGIKGELTEISSFFPNTHLIHIARLLKWQQYASKIQAHNRFSHCYYIEVLTQEHEHYLRKNAKQFLPLKLPVLSGASDTQNNIALSKHSLPEHYCAIVHSGCDNEIEILLRYATDRFRMQNRALPIVLITPDSPTYVASYPNVISINAYPSLPILLNADVVVSGAGFNTLHELNGQCKEHWVLPFERRYDDQFMRAARYRSTYYLGT